MVLCFEVEVIECASDDVDLLKGFFRIGYTCGSMLGRGGTSALFFELDLNAFRIDAKDDFLLNGDVVVPEVVDVAIDGCGT